MGDLTLPQVVLRLFAFVLIAGLHGVTVAATACVLGDAGPRYDGRLRLNPLVHLDLIGLLSGVIFLVGWSKPVAIDPADLRFGRFGPVIIVLAAAAAPLAAVLALRFVRPWLLPLMGDSSSVLAFALIETISELGTWFALINLLPLPPLTGSHLLTAVLPHIRKSIERMQFYAGLVLLAVSATGLVTGALAPAQRKLALLLLGH